jgi:hypothetical protein
MKQSVGTVCCEFLRMAISSNFAIGYLSRSIASAVSGSWTNENPLEAHERLRSAINTTVSMKNRSCGKDMSIFVVPGVHKATNIGRRKIGGILRGEYGIDGSPVFSDSDFAWRGYSMRVSASLDREFDRLVASKERNATSDYLSNCVADIELEALRLTGSGVTSSMLKASYAKSLTFSAPDIKKSVVSLTRVKSIAATGSIFADLVLKKQRIDGALARYPIIMLMKNTLTGDMVKTLLRHLHIDIGNRDPWVIAFGPESLGNTVRGIMSYADACSMGSRVGRCVIYATYAVHM